MNRKGYKMRENNRYGFKINEGKVEIFRMKNGKVIENCEVLLENIFWGGKIKCPIQVDEESRDRIIQMEDLSVENYKLTGEYREKGGDTGIICLYTNAGKKSLSLIMFHTREQMYKRFIHFKHINESVYLKRSGLHLKFDGSLYTDKNKDLSINKVEIVIDFNHREEIDLKLTEEKENFNTYLYNCSLDSIVLNETEINNAIHIEVEMKDGTILKYNIGHKTHRDIPKKFFYVPITSIYHKNYALAVRGNVNENYSLVVRPMDPVEHTLDFRIKESKIVSAFFYHVVGKLKTKKMKRPINLYYEKNSMKADEGCFEIFEESLKNNTSRNYFILDKKSELWPELKKHKNVVARFSWRYYFLLYSAQNYISTETSSHLNVHRAINPYVRKTLLESKLIFLQHGVTYMKAQGANSVFGADKEGEPSIIAVCSEKEAKVVADMLRIPKERCMIAGLPVFSTIKYNHIDKNSRNIVTIMLTWKPYEEHLLDHFEDSSYFKSVYKIYNILVDKVGAENIRIVPHPKVYEHLCGTSMRDAVWASDVSSALGDTKLLITDYSSVAYNCFYQGAGVIFYQPDLELYQECVGKLIPDDSEYIGYRTFDLNELENVINEGVGDRNENGLIDLSYYRSNRFIQNYKSINAFSDGKNITRIVEYLTERKVI